jgi:hypothetical protein
MSVLFHFTYDVASITSFAVVAPQLHQHEVHLLCACMRTSVKRDNSFNCDYLDDTRIRFIRVLQVPQASQRFALEGFPPFILWNAPRRFLLEVW